MDSFERLRQSLMGRRSLLQGMGAAAIGITFTGALAGCERKDAGTNWDVRSVYHEQKK